MNNPFRSYEDTQSVFDVIKKEFFPMTEAEKLSQEMMSDDIVARLREAALSARTTERVICDEAADEIERILAREARLREALREIEWSNNSAWQSDRARAALGEEKK
jgi:hypothetical protein